MGGWRWTSSTKSNDIAPLCSTELSLLFVSLLHSKCPIFFPAIASSTEATEEVANVNQKSKLVLKWLEYGFISHEAAKWPKPLSIIQRQYKNRRAYITKTDKVKKSGESTERTRMKPTRRTAVGDVQGNHWRHDMCIESAYGFLRPECFSCRLRMARY